MPHETHFLEEVLCLSLKFPSASKIGLSPDPKAIASLYSFKCLVLGSYTVKPSTACLLLKAQYRFLFSKEETARITHSQLNLGGSDAP